MVKWTEKQVEEILDKIEDEIGSPAEHNSPLVAPEDPDAYEYYFKYKRRFIEIFGTKSTPNEPLELKENREWFSLDFEAFLINDSEYKELRIKRAKKQIEEYLETHDHSYNLLKENPEEYRRQLINLLTGIQGGLYRLMIDKGMNPVEIMGEFEAAKAEKIADRIF